MEDHVNCRSRTTTERPSRSSSRSSADVLWIHISTSPFLSSHHHQIRLSFPGPGSISLEIAKCTRIVPALRSSLLQLEGIDSVHHTDARHLQWISSQTCSHAMLATAVRLSSDVKSSSQIPETMLSTDKTILLRTRAQGTLLLALRQLRSHPLRLLWILDLQAQV